VELKLSIKNIAFLDKYGNNSEAGQCKYFLDFRGLLFQSNSKSIETLFKILSKITINFSTDTNIKIMLKSPEIPNFVICKYHVSLTR